MVAADTNVLVRLITREDDQQLPSAEAFVSEGVWISNIVLVEAMWVLHRTYRRDHAEIARIIRMLLGERHIALQNVDVVRSALDLYERHPSLGFSDCLILEIERKAGHLPLGTFDRPLGRLAGAQRL